jgi:hypothetical protein
MSMAVELPENFKVDALEAAQLSALAYMPLPELFNWSARENQPAAELTAESNKEWQAFRELLPIGWRFSRHLSGYGYNSPTPATATTSTASVTPTAPATVDQNNQVVVFINDEKRQVVLAFKGTDNWQNAYSDIANDGASEWQKVSQVAKKIVASKGVDGTEGYTWSVTGHSLGGGMAQTCAVLYGMSGHGQNPLPIAHESIMSVNWVPDVNGMTVFKDKVGAWEKNNAFVFTHVQGEAAYKYYHDLQHKCYIHTHALELSNHVAQDAPHTVADAIKNVASSVYRLAATSTGYILYDAHKCSTIIKVMNELDKRDISPNPQIRKATFWQTRLPRESTCRHFRQPSPRSLSLYRTYRGRERRHLRSYLCRSGDRNHSDRDRSNLRLIFLLYQFEALNDDYERLVKSQLPLTEDVSHGLTRIKEYFNGSCVSHQHCDDSA